jgi:hypothetical protein
MVVWENEVPNLESTILRSKDGAGDLVTQHVGNLSVHIPTH